MNFQHPSLLYISPLILFFAYLFLRFAEKRKATRLHSLFHPSLLPDLTKSLSPFKVSLKHTFQLLALLFLLLAAARPQAGYYWEEHESKGFDFLFALDTSKSMLAEDIKPNRLSRSKLAILDFINKVPHSNRVGLIAFAGTAFLQCPLTLDYAAFEQTLDSLDHTTIPIGGTDIASAINIAQQTFENSKNHKFLIIISDGEDLQKHAVEQAASASTQNLIIYTIGVGTSKGELLPVPESTGSVDFVRDSAGNPVKSKLDESTLQAISKATKGSYFPLGIQGDGLEKTYNLIASSFQLEHASTYLVKIPKEQFHIPLLAACCFIILDYLISNRKYQFRFLSKHKHSLFSLLTVILFLLFFSSPLVAASTAQSAYDSYYQKNYQQSLSNYLKLEPTSPNDPLLQFNLGAAYYQTKDYEKSLNAYQKSLNTADPTLQAKIYYNIANTFYRIGQSHLPKNPDQTIPFWQKSIQNYQQTLQLNPNDLNAKHNKEFVEKKLQELQKNQQPPPQQQPQNNQQQDQSSQSQQDNNQSPQSNSQQNQQQDNNTPNTTNNSQPKESKSSNKTESPNQSDSSQKKPDQQPANASSPNQSQPTPKPQQPTQNQPSLTTASQLNSDKISQEDALRLLDSLKNDEKNLPLYQLSPNNTSTSSPQNQQDW